jgi:hypothetical protein
LAKHNRFGQATNSKDNVLEARNCSTFWIPFGNVQVNLQHLNGLPKSQASLAFTGEVQASGTPQDNTWCPIVGYTGGDSIASWQNPDSCFGLVEGSEQLPMYVVWVNVSQDTTNFYLKLYSDSGCSTAVGNDGPYYGSGCIFPPGTTAQSALIYDKSVIDD